MSEEKETQSKQSLSAIVMAAGKGTRLKSKLPKVLQPLLGKTLIHRVLEVTAELAVSQCFVIVGHQHDVVRESLQSVPMPFSIDTVLQQPQLGTGHAVMQVKAQCNDKLSGQDVLILSGDVPLLTKETLQSLVNQHRQNGHQLTLLAASVAKPTGYGRVILNDKNQLTAIVEEKDASEAQRQITLINAGVYCINWQTVAPLLDKLSDSNAQGEFYLTDLIGLGQAEGFSMGVSVIDDVAEITGINNRKDLAEAHRLLNQKTLNTLLDNGVTIIDPISTWIAPEVTIESDTTIYPGCYLTGNVSVAGNCTIGPATTLTGNVSVGHSSSVIQSQVVDSTIGQDCIVGPFAHLRNQAVLQNQVRVGNFVEVKNSTIDSDTNVSHLSYIGDAALGKEVNVGAGTITANYNAITNTKHQTVLKDGVKVGSNAVFVAPVTVNEHATIAAGSVITEEVAANALAITRPKQANIDGWVLKKKQQLVSSEPSAK